jgi:hypothetical protein
LYYMLALLLTLMIVPPFTFLLSKVWAFSKWSKLFSALMIMLITKESLIALSS